MPIERLTAEDEMMLWPDRIWPQDIGALAILDGTSLLDPEGRFRVEAVRQAVESRLHLVPRFRQLLYVPRRRLGGPLWIDAPAFDISDHVQTAPLPAPGGEAQLLSAVERLRRRRLDWSRPLWEMWFLPGLPGQRVGMFVRMHHAMADGMAAMAAMAAFLDPNPSQSAEPARPWTAAPAPTADELLADHRGKHLHRVGCGLRALAHPVTSTRQVRAGWPAMHELLAQRPLPATSLDRLVGPGRALALIRGRLDQVQQAARAHGATINDVLLAITAGGLRELLGSRSELGTGTVVRIYVPVSLHREPQAQASGNLIGQMVVPLPVGATDPERMLRQIAADTTRRKAESRPSLGHLPRRGLTGRAFLKLVSRQKVNVTSADIPGPREPLYFAGAPLLEVFPLVQLLGTVSLAVGAMSYAGQFNIMVVADRDSYPDLDVFVAGVQDELRAFALQSGAAVLGPPTAAAASVP
jgi:WS/DGAT/MGAT family acyltransferase